MVPYVLHSFHDLIFHLVIIYMILLFINDNLNKHKSIDMVLHYIYSLKINMMDLL